METSLSDKGCSNSSCANKTNLSAYLQEYLSASESEDGQVNSTDGINVTCVTCVNKRKQVCLYQYNWLLELRYVSGLYIPYLALLVFQPRLVHLSFYSQPGIQCAVFSKQYLQAQY